MFRLKEQTTDKSTRTHLTSNPVEGKADVKIFEMINAFIKKIRPYLDLQYCTHLTKYLIHKGHYQYSVTSPSITDYNYLTHSVTVLHSIKRLSLKKKQKP